VLAQPAQLRGREARHPPAADEVGEARHELLDLPAFLVGPAVVPQQGGAERPITPVEQGDAEHLA
jgi:hypothetical protein